MPKKVNLTDSVMDQIQSKNIEIKPKAYFMLSSVILFLSLVASVIASIFLVNIIAFLLKTHGPMGQYRFEQLISSFPWWAPLLAIIGIIISIKLLKKYDFSYKVNFFAIAALLVFAIIAAGFLIDYFNLDNAWLKRGPMQGVMRQYMQNSGNSNGQFQGQGYQRGLRLRSLDN